MVKNMMTMYNKYQPDTNLHNCLCSYILVCNDILGANKTRFPFSQMWRALETEIGGRPIEYSVTRDADHAAVTATFIQLEIKLVTLSGQQNWPAVTQKIDWSYMSRVLEKPANFIANPALVDWNIKIDDKVVQLFS